MQVSGPFGAADSRFRRHASRRVRVKSAGFVGQYLEQGGVLAVVGPGLGERAPMGRQMITGARTLAVGLLCGAVAGAIGVFVARHRSIPTGAVIVAVIAAAASLLVVAALWGVGESYKLLLVKDHDNLSVASLQTGAMLISLAPVPAIAGATAVVRRAHRQTSNRHPVGVHET